MIDVLLIIIALFWLFFASYSDIKTREVPDWLTYSLIFLAFGVRIIYSFVDSFFILISGLIGFVIFFILAYIFYYTGQWGGGDSKLLMGMGAIVGVTYPFTSNSWDLLFYFFALLFLGAIYGVIYMIIIAIIHSQKFWYSFKLGISKSKKLHYSLFVFSALIFILSFFLPILFFFVILPPFFFYFFIFINAVEKSCFYKEMKIKDLTEGDWLAQKIYINGKELKIKETLEKEDLLKLKQLAFTKKIKTVLIKEGIPFVPSFLIAYLALLFAKDFFMFFLSFGLL